MEDINNENDKLINHLAEELASNMHQTIQVLSTIVSISEKLYEGSHSRFVAEKSVQVAEELGMNEDDIYELKIAGLLHDIGKVGFVDSALYKYPKEMSPFEYTQYMKHCEVGMQLLKPYKPFQKIGEIIYQHHEKLDGTGFPRNLQGNNILPSAKIIAVVDFFHNAVYKKPRTKVNTPASLVKSASAASIIEQTQSRFNTALNYIFKKAGILYEKKVVEVFIEIIQAERISLGQKSVLRLPVNKIEEGMVFAEDYYTNYGMLIAAKGEKISSDMIKALVRFAENDQIPMKILVLK